MITDNFSVWAELQSALLRNRVDWVLSFVYMVSLSRMHLESAANLLWDSCDSLLELAGGHQQDLAIYSFYMEL